MKYICILITAFLLEASAVFSQSSSTIYLRDSDFSILKSHMVTFQSTGEKEQMTISTDLENVSALTFLQNDSLVLISETGSPVYTQLGDIQVVNKYKKRFSLVLGIALGAAGGGILGGVIGWAVSGSEQKSGGNLFDPLVSGVSDATSRTTGAIVGAFIGAVGGGVLGAVITNAINRVSLDLFSVPDKDKKLRLIKFLRKNK